jgi:predicted secreted hydrolase
MNRRQCLIAGLGLPLVWPDWSHALTRQVLQFPRDFGSHPSYAIEWWYVTGQLQSGQRQFGFQLTFFRSRVEATQAMASHFAAKQLIFAHAAVTDVAEKRLWHDQRIARTSGHGQVDLAFASEADTDVYIGNWSLKRQEPAYQARAIGQDFSFDLALRNTQTVLLQGDQGLSRKGPEARQASFYYSRPQLLAQGELTFGGQKLPVSGLGWLDHEWSQSLLHPQAVGWDWIGMNLLDGSTLTAFQLRKNNGEPLWAGGSFRRTWQTQADILVADQVRFIPQRRWRSVASGTSYPVQWSVEISRKPAFNQPGQTDRYTVSAVIDNQELDSRQSTGAIYWEGLSELFDSNGQLLGRGYLEMTGYGSPLRL